MMSKHDDDFPWAVGRKWVESMLDLELAKHVFELSDEARTKLLAFLHLVEDSHLVEGDLHVAQDGRITLRLSSRKGRTEGSTPDRGSAAEPFQ
jgi:hypothetical protein